MAKRGAQTGSGEPREVWDARVQQRMGVGGRTTWGLSREKRAAPGEL